MFYNILTYVNLIIEILGVGVIFLGILVGIVKAITEVIAKENAKKIYIKIREEIARSILLGLELLIAADIIKTVTTDLTLESVGTLALIVVIRTVLSISLEVEIDRKFPWQKK